MNTYIFWKGRFFIFVGKRKISGLQKAKPMIRLLDRIDGVAKYKNNWSKTLDKFYCLAPGATTEKLVKPHDTINGQGWFPRHLLENGNYIFLVNADSRK